MPTQTTQPQVASAPTPGFARRKARALIGWLTIEEGALWLSGRQMTQGVSERHRALCEAARAIVAGRAPGVDQTGLFQDLGGDVAEHIASLRSDPLGAQVLAEAGEPRLVDLSKVCAAQPQILVEDARRRVEGIDPHDVVALARMTLPIPSPEQIPAATKGMLCHAGFGGPDPSRGLGLSAGPRDG